MASHSALAGQVYGRKYTDHWGDITIMNSEKNKPNGERPKRDEESFGSNSEIARRLRTYYRSLVSNDVPDRFTDLLSQLENAETGKKG